MSLLAMVGLLCFLLGILVGVAARDAYDLLRSVMAKPREATMFKRSACWLRSNALILLVVLFAGTQVVLAVLLIQARAATNDYTECKADWDQQFMASYTARVDAAKVVSEAMDRLIQGVASGDRAEFVSALDHYLDVRSDQRAAQEANPLPEPPEKVCGGTDQ